MKISILVVSLLVSGLIRAQDLEQISRSRELTEIRGNMNLEGIKDVSGKKQSNVDGSPYLFKSWNNISKIYYDDRVYVITSFNYNIYSERFESKLSEDSILIINPRNIKNIEINNKVFGRYLDPEFQRNSYFEEIVKMDGYFLLKKHIVKIKKASVNPLTKVKLSNDKLVQDEIYFLCDLKDNSLKKVKLKKSTIQSLVSKEFIQDVTNYVKDNNLSYKDDDDVKKIVQYYNTL